MKEKYLISLHFSVNGRIHAMLLGQDGSIRTCPPETRAALRFYGHNFEWLRQCPMYALTRKEAYLIPDDTRDTHT